VVTSKDSVTVWTQGPHKRQWAREVFEDHGHDDLVRVLLDWMVGSEPGAADMQLDNRIKSELESGGGTTRDVHTFVGGGAPPEVTTGCRLVLLGATLSAQAKSDGVLYIDRTQRR
jgi:hypothetical protein